MKKKVLWLWMGLTVLLAACDDADVSLDPSVSASRTVLVYIAGENSLSSFASEDVEEMMEGIRSVDTSLYNLLVYVDDRTETALYRLATDGKGNAVKEVVWEYEEQDSTDPDVMSSVLSQAFGGYPAESYGLVYWSHADGWIPYPLSTGASTLWVGQDTGSGDNRMNLSELSSVLAAAPHLDFLMFDACFMLSVEVAYELREYADYYIASPTENPGPGAPYDKIVPLMFTENAAVAMAAAYFDVYDSIYNGGVGITNSNWTGGTSIGVIQTDGLESLAQATKQVLPETAPAVSALRGTVFDYDKRTYSDGHVGYYDMQDLVETLAEDETSFNAWLQAYGQVVGYWNTTPKNYSQFVGMFSMENTHGVTHYIPSQTSDLQAAEAYRSVAWYSASGLSGLGW